MTNKEKIKKANALLKEVWHDRCTKSPGVVAPLTYHLLNVALETLGHVLKQRDLD